jgi:hypothetical protein
MIQKLDRRVKSLEGPSVSLKRGISETADSVNNRVGEDVRRAQNTKKRMCMDPEESTDEAGHPRPG